MDKKYLLFPILILLSINPAQGFASELTLAQSIRMVVEKSPVMTELLSRYKALVAQTKRTRGVYDWEMNLSAGYADQDQAQVSVFQPSNIRQTDYNLDLTKRMALGTSLGLAASLTKTKDNSSFSTFPSRYEPGVSISLSQELLDGFIGLPDAAELKTDQMRIKAIQLALWRDIEMLAVDVAMLYWEL